MKSLKARISFSTVIKTYLSCVVLSFKFAYWIVINTRTTSCDLCHMPHTLDCCSLYQPESSTHVSLLITDSFNRISQEQISFS